MTQVDALGVIFPCELTQHKISTNTQPGRTLGVLCSPYFVVQKNYELSSKYTAWKTKRRLEAYFRRRSEQWEAVCEHLSVFVVLHEGSSAGSVGMEHRWPHVVVGSNTNISLLQVMYTWSICTRINQVSQVIDTNTAPETEMDWKLKINMNNNYYFFWNKPNTGL